MDIGSARAVILVSGNFFQLDRCRVCVVLLEQHELVLVSMRTITRIRISSSQNLIGIQQEPEMRQAFAMWQV
jgi:hypothetical protein